MHKEEKMFEILYESFLSKLKNLDFSNKRLLICFASAPAGGKSSISNMLESRMKAVVINSGDVQRELEKYRGEQFYEGFIQEKREFIYWLMSKVVNEFDNGLIVLDKSTDRTYVEVEKWCKKNEYPFIVISLEVSKDELKRRLVEREGKNANDYLIHLDRWFEEHEEFKKNHKYDFSFNTKSESVESIVDRLEEYIKEI